MHYEQFTYPAYDAPLIQAYGGRFESVFVVLHPFIAVPEHLAWKTVKSYPADEQILALGTKVPWAEAAVGTGLGNCAKLNHALLTSIRSIGNEACDFEASRSLQRYLESNAVWMPTEGRFEPMLQADLLAAFDSADQNSASNSELVYVPEFPAVDPVQRLSVAALKSGAIPFPMRGTLMPADASFLITVDWDSFFTLFYGSRAFITQVARRRNIEGFFASLTTEHFWFNYVMGCATVTISPEHWQLVE